MKTNHGDKAENSKVTRDNVLGLDIATQDIIQLMEAELGISRKVCAETTINSIRHSVTR